MVAEPRLTAISGDWLKQSDTPKITRTEIHTMALVPCPECQKEVSTEACACPQCAYPFPGKHVSQAGRPPIGQKNCPQCDGPVAQYAQACPHCGVSFVGGHGHHVDEGESIQETLRCPHCGASYIHTRKVSRTIGANLGSKGTITLPTPGTQLETTEIGDGHGDSSRKAWALQGSRRRPPLWEDPSVLQEVSSHRYPRSRKKSIIVGLLLLVIVAISVMVGAMWQLKGLNPLEAILYWRM